VHIPIFESVPQPLESSFGLPESSEHQGDVEGGT
jgi:hypothetical protein